MARKARRGFRLALALRAVFHVRDKCLLRLIGGRVRSALLGVRLETDGTIRLAPKSVEGPGFTLPWKTATR